MRAGREPSWGPERGARGGRAARPHPHQRPARPPDCALGPARGVPRQRPYGAPPVGVTRPGGPRASRTPSGARLLCGLM